MRSALVPSHEARGPGDGGSNALPEPYAANQVRKPRVDSQSLEPRGRLEKHQRARSIVERLFEKLKHDPAVEDRQRRERARMAFS
jgi:hypothetical protein